ncbi:DUF3592 domain-containing protein [Nannocystis bainbridge]|uniref:DUF3592 domain-containing protein n=1 Tax=Nannocystis bainbridge TaxID=2995303 RepID=A0ABT5E6T4_9BACT|nr:DUF3592 domain-containing protein [Nannocystis bainbridge]MDC0721574.1 DUF3592 domain-containing protein [Nannocystis bainbridge]
MRGSTVVGLFGVVLIVVGLVLAIVGARALAATQLAEGRVVSLRPVDELFAPDIAYVTQGGESRVFHAGIATQTPYAIGEEVPIVYDLADDAWAEIDTWGARWLLPLIFAGAGGQLVFSALIWLLVARRHERVMAAIVRDGARVEGTIVSVEQDRSDDELEHHPWVILCQFVLPGDRRLRLVKSQLFWYDPRPHLQGPTLPVCYDPRDPQRVVIDTRALPPDP